MINPCAHFEDHSTVNTSHSISQSKAVAISFNYLSELFESTHNLEHNKNQSYVF